MSRFKGCGGAPNGDLTSPAFLFSPTETGCRLGEGEERLRRRRRPKKRKAPGTLRYLLLATRGRGARGQPHVLYNRFLSLS